MKRRKLELPMAVALMGVLLLVPNGYGQSKPARVVQLVDGDPVYQVLPAGAIPAIMDPVYLQGEEADRQMSPDEPVMGLLHGGEARAYSLWQLDAHEIVNDEIGGTPIAVTW